MNVIQKINLQIVTIVVLAVAFFIVSNLYVKEKNKMHVDALQQAKQVCSNVTTDAQRATCSKALQDIQIVLTSIKE